MTVARPKTLEAATALLERVAAIGAELAAKDAGRRAALATVNATVDAEQLPLLEEREAITAVLEPWWAKAGPNLTAGKRKSIELGGCKIGTETARESLAFAHGDDRAALAAVEASEHRAKVTEVKRVLDKRAIMEFVRGSSKVGTALKALGFAIGGGGETFFIKRIDSAGAKVSAQ